MKYLFVILLAFFSSEAIAQETIDSLLKKHNTDKTAPYISVEELVMLKNNPIIFDSREPKEYNVSHLKDAILVGYDTFNIASIEKKHPNKNKKIIVYCSLGIRSQTIGNKLKKAGYTNVYNLYGGIFEWKNKDFSVVDSNNKETEKIHTFNKEWSKWLTKGEKVFEENVKK